jgi:hypothetical protein
MPRPLSTTVIGVVDVNGDVDLIAEAGQRLVDRVVDDFVDEMMQPGRPVDPMYMAGACAPPRALEDLDLVGAVVVAPLPSTRRPRRSWRDDVPVRRSAVPDVPRDSLEAARGCGGGGRCARRSSAGEAPVQIRIGMMTYV